MRIDDNNIVFTYGSYHIVRETAQGYFNTFHVVKANESGYYDHIYKGTLTECSLYLDQIKGNQNYLKLIDIRKLYDTKVVVALEQRVESQVEASGMDASRLHRLDGEKLIDTILEALENP